MADLDLIIRGGLIADGSGGEPFEADVGIEGGKIAQIGSIRGRGREEIDARHHVVTPGFIDVHTHYDGQITWEERLAPSSEHGVTTVVMGNCGVGFAPCRRNDHQLVVELMEGVEDIPDAVMTQGIPWNWETFPEYLDALAGRNADVDFAAQLPHSPLRVFVMGRRGAQLQPPTAEDLAEMRRLTCQAVRAGAIGVSTSHTLAHRFRDGRPAPSVGTQSDEVLALALGLKDAGRGVFQMVPNMDISPQKRFDLLRSVAQASGRPVSFTFLDSSTSSADSTYTLHEMEQAALEGLTIRGQIIPRPVGALLGLELSYNPFSLNPSYRALKDLPLAAKVSALRDPQLRARLLAEQPQDPNPFFKTIVTDLEQMFVLGDPPNYHPKREDSVASQARRLGLDPRELIYDALLQREGTEVLYRPMGNTGGERFESAGRAQLKSEHTIMGLGDGGAHYSMICDAAFPTYLLTYWARDIAKDGRLPLPWAIKKLTSETAVAMGFTDRGLLRPGFKADLNVIDVDRLRLHAPRTAYDLPAGGRRLRQSADGYAATIVSGRITYRDATPTGVLPGRLVRSADAALS